MGAAAAEHTVERQLAAGVWALERPPQLLSDFGGGSNRTSYEIARMQWYEQWTGESLPPYDPCAAASERKQQVDARAPPWQKATRSYKDTKVRKRKRPDRRTESDRVFEARWSTVESLERRNATDALRRRVVRQQVWARDIHALAENSRVDGAAHESWPLSSAPWPQGVWRWDAERIRAVAEYVTQHPPTGERTWWYDVDAHAAQLHGVPNIEQHRPRLAAGYCMLMLLPSTPRMLRWDRDKAHSRMLHAKVAHEQELRHELLHKTSIKPANVRAGLAEQRQCEPDAVSDADVQDERQWRMGKSLATFCKCNFAVLPRDTSQCFMHTHVKDCLGKRSGATQLEIQRLHAEAEEQGKCVGEVVVEVDEQLQPVLPLRLRTRLKDVVAPPPAPPPPPIPTQPLTFPLPQPWPTEREQAEKAFGPSPPPLPADEPPGKPLPPGKRCTAITSLGKRCCVTAGHPKIGAPLLGGQPYCKTHMRRLPYRNPRPIPKTGAGRPKPTDQCSKCKQHGHWRSHCPNAWVAGPCHTCGEIGHFKYACPKRSVYGNGGE